MCLPKMMFLVLFCAFHHVQAADVHSKLTDLEILPYDAMKKSIGKIYSLNEESFRLYLGIADECTQVVMCKNEYSPPPGTDGTGTAASGAAPAPAKAIKFDAAMCTETITFNLLDNSVKQGGKLLGYLVSPVADFMHKSGSEFNLKLLKTITSSDLKDAKLEDVTVTLNWNKTTVLSSGFDCDASIESFVRQGSSNTQQIGAGVSAVRLTGGARQYKVPFPAPSAPTAEQLSKCADTIQKPDMVAGWGQYVEPDKSKPTTPAKFTIGLKQAAGDGVDSIQLEVKDPANCDYVRVCFAAECAPNKELDLVFYHRYYVPIDSDRAAPFHVPVGELETFVFDFTKTALVMRYGAVASASEVKWVTHHMTFDGTPSAMTVISSKCPFRVSRPLSNNLMSATGQATRSKLHPTSCK